MNFPTSPAYSAPVSPRPEDTSTGFASFLSLWLIVVPLFLGALVLGVDCNIQQYLDRLERDVQFVVMLKSDIRADEAAGLAAEWRRSGNWIEAKASSALDNLSKIEELNRWVADDQNREILDPLPFSIELRPSAILNPDASPDKMAKDLMNAPETEQVFYDNEGIAWMRKVNAGWHGLRIYLYAAAGIMALVGSALAGYVNERLLTGRGNHPATTSLASAGLACSSGLVAVAALGVLYGLLSFGLRLPLSFLPSTSIAAVIVTGAGLGLLVMAAKVWIHTRLGRVLLPLLMAGLIAGWTPAFSAEAASAPASSALPQQAGEAGPGLSARDAAQRSDLEQEITRQVSEKEKIIEYLNDWLRRSDEERKLDQENRRLHQIKTGLSADASRSAEMDSARHQDEGQRFCAALVQTGGHFTKSPGNAGSRAQQALVSRLLLNSANKSLFLLDIDRREAKRQLAAVEELSTEKQRLDIFSRMADQSPEAVEAEKRRVEGERLSLLQKRTLLQSNPQAFERTQAPREPLLSEKTEVPLNVREIRRTMNSSTNRLPQNDLAYYLSTPAGSLIHAVYGGKVLFASKFTGLGQAVIVEHDGGLSTLYGFLSEIVVKPGQVIQTGDYIGSAGIVRPQGVNGIRFEVRNNGQLTALSRIPGLTAQNAATLLKGGGK